MGSLAIQIARIKGAAKVIGLALPRGHDRVSELGAEPSNYREEGWGARQKTHARRRRCVPRFHRRARRRRFRDAQHWNPLVVLVAAGGTDAVNEALAVEANR